ncbi:hypothetical protein FHS29_000728 [Saccharothrix tamanrassetensis]|uniref:Uncharacterized protein n=1 Tax=Saccharothrix tamanrassetensis TaxID=1051531 RepID=A0A841CDA8_9PSEU|nr:hypothetical protein [Saccharothrix tamanrassetensis]
MWSDSRPAEPGSAPAQDGERETEGPSPVGVIAAAPGPPRVVPVGRTRQIAVIRTASCSLFEVKHR